MHYMRDYYRYDTISIRNQRLGLSVLVFFSLIDFVVVLLNLQSDSNQRLFMYPWLASFLKPGILVMLNQKVRNYTRRYIFVIIGTLPMVIFIVAYVGYFAFSGVYLFAGTLEGSLSFSSFWNAFY
jgi:hypothetical protein